MYEFSSRTNEHFVAVGNPSFVRKKNGMKIQRKTIRGSRFDGCN
jgi:hypothetical protein